MSTQFVESTNENALPKQMLAVNDTSGTPAAQKKSFQERVREFERQIIAEALEEAGGGVTKAARDLGLTHQGLCYIINHRHKDLLTARTPIRIRRKSIIAKGNLRRRPK